MSKVRLQIANVAKETGALLTEYLEDRGLQLVREGHSGVICYGVPTDFPKNLNGECGGGDKIRRLLQMEAGNVRTVPWFKGNVVPLNFKFPALARNLSGHGGTDIVPVFEPQEVKWRLEAGWNWFSSYIPVKTEYRVWTFRDEVLDVYEKVMKRPNEYRYVGRNFRNGFDFQHIRREEVPVDAIRQAQMTTRAIKFDFAAVDMLLGWDGKIYVLEANSAPGVLRSGAQATLAKLADRMVDWVKNDCPARKY